jgi:phosphoribosyl 1,2-cyclic phosphodiesterase
MRLAELWRTPQGLDALFIPHEHADHVRGAGVFARKFGVPVYVTRRTFACAKRRFQLGPIEDVRHFLSGDSVKVGGVTVHTVSTPHDAVDGSVFVVDDGAARLGICTDVGHVFADLRSLVGSVDALFLESNYDEGMLASGRYHASLKRRITGAGGHISNREAAELVARHAGAKLQWLCLAHLSAENNTPALALACHREALGHALPIHVASRQHLIGPIAITAGDHDRAAFRVPSQRFVQLAFDFGV